MSKRLDEVIEKLRELPESDQDMLASHIDEAISALRSDRKWEQLLANSPDTLAALAEEAREAEKNGETDEMTVERLRQGG